MSKTKTKSDADFAAELAEQKMRHLEEIFTEHCRQHQELLERVRQEAELGEITRLAEAERLRMAREANDAKDQRAREIAAALFEKGNQHG